MISELYKIVDFHWKTLYFLFSGQFSITSLLDAILLLAWFHLGFPNPTKSRLGGVLRRFGDVMKRLGDVVGHLLKVLWTSLERLRRSVTI